MSTTMNTTKITEAAARTVAGPPHEVRRFRAVLALARFEARELLFHLPVGAFLVMYLAWTAWQLFNGQEGMNDYPALQDVDRTTQTGSALLAMALLVCVNSTALRSRRRGLDEYYGTLPMEPWRRTLAHALSVVPYALLVALVVTFEYTWAALKPGAVGHGSVFELAVGPLTVLLSGITGVLLARLAPFRAAALILVVGVYALLVLTAAGTGHAPWLYRLLPADPEIGGAPIPTDLLGRPAAWHALYLAGLTVLMLCAALLLSGGRTRAVRAVAFVALAATVAGVAGQSPGDSAALTHARWTATVSPQKDQKCVAKGTSTYCAFPEWSGRSADWAEVVDRVQGLAGGSAATERLTVRQRVAADGPLGADAALDVSGRRGEVTVGTRWGGNRVPEFAVGVASVLVAGTEKAALTMCDARVVTMMWLTLGTDPAPLDTFQRLRLDDSVIGSAVVLAPTGSISMSAHETDVVRELLDRPHDTVAAQVKAHWKELTSPKTSAAQAARLLGVKVPEGADECAG
ncbi:ABC transporter permease [Streptomyces sp. NPDC059010]|uniref:ABC transporter permease n=1 Tax=Streptomyces sp. NPDC059010 TaxID=3346695 RepID=UPI0036892C7E